MGEGEGGMFWENSIETSILSSVKQITNPGWMHETSAQGWCTGKTQRDGMGREEGGGIGMGNACKSMADSCQCMAKPLQHCKVISLQLIKINEKNELKNKIKPLPIFKETKQTNKKQRSVLFCRMFLHLICLIHSSWWVSASIFLEGVLHRCYTVLYRCYIGLSQCHISVGTWGQFVLLLLLLLAVWHVES